MNIVSPSHRLSILIEDIQKILGNKTFVDDVEKILIQLGDLERQGDWLNKGNNWWDRAQGSVDPGNPSLPGNYDNDEEGGDNEEEEEE